MLIEKACEGFEDTYLAPARKKIEQLEHELEVHNRARSQIEVDIAADETVALRYAANKKALDQNADKLKKISYQLKAANVQLNLLVKRAEFFRAQVGARAGVNPRGDNDGVDGERAAQ
jgi:hypothetical protein